MAEIPKHLNVSIIHCVAFAFFANGSTNFVANFQLKIKELIASPMLVWLHTFLKHIWLDWVTNIRVLFTFTITSKFVRKKQKNMKAQSELWDPFIMYHMYSKWNLQTNFMCLFSFELIFYGIAAIHKICCTYTLRYSIKHVISLEAFTEIHRYLALVFLLLFTVYFEFPWRFPLFIQNKLLLLLHFMWITFKKG